MVCPHVFLPQRSLWPPNVKFCSSEISLCFNAESNALPSHSLLTAATFTIIFRQMKQNIFFSNYEIHITFSRSSTRYSTHINTNQRKCKLNKKQRITLRMNWIFNFNLRVTFDPLQLIISGSLNCTEILLIENHPVIFMIRMLKIDLLYLKISGLIFSDSLIQINRFIFQTMTCHCIKSL